MDQNLPLKTKILKKLIWSLRPAISSEPIVRFDQTMGHFVP